jgi:hypothetical protein
MEEGLYVSLLIDAMTDQMCAQTAMESLCTTNVLTPNNFTSILKTALKRGANPNVLIRFGENSFDYACKNNRSYEFLKTLAYAGCWFNPALEYRDSDEIRQLKKSKEICSNIVVVLYGVLKKRLNQHRDTTRIIASMIWENRFDML